jgi:prevent-host-death family protein
MRTVNIAELKNRLSTYVKYAKAGETVIIRDRNTPVAQLVPLPAMDGLDDGARRGVCFCARMNGCARQRRRRDSAYCDRELTISRRCLLRDGRRTNESLHCTRRMRHLR